MEEYHDLPKMASPCENQDKIEALEARVRQLELELQALRSQMDDLLSTKKRSPSEAPAGYTYLSDFCTLHYIPYKAAEELFPRSIRGQNFKDRGRWKPIIGKRGKRDFYVQLHTRPDFRTCDDCPHEYSE